MTRSYIKDGQSLVVWLTASHFTSLSLVFLNCILRGYDQFLPALRFCDFCGFYVFSNPKVWWSKSLLMLTHCDSSDSPWKLFYTLAPPQRNQLKVFFFDKNVGLVLKNAVSLHAVWWSCLRNLSAASWVKLLSKWTDPVLTWLSIFWQPAIASLALCVLSTTGHSFLKRGESLCVKGCQKWFRHLHFKGILCKAAPGLCWNAQKGSGSPCSTENYSVSS